ncbi:small nuclear ribonucleoprotein family protein [Actinidia rufa]|uniref:Small nuclear ribonucleoprotein family protein n=1 Tax=Actinidia rufa TaxID=165716 RepID=A0A7J0F4D1_9ERIC|nr:small nuclear ribonucleoprotein family protein [Actinidia rufa]
MDHIKTTTTTILKVRPASRSQEIHGQAAANITLVRVQPGLQLPLQGTSGAYALVCTQQRLVHWAVRDMSTGLLESVQDCWALGCSTGAALGCAGLLVHWAAWGRYCWSARDRSCVLVCARQRLMRWAVSDRGCWCAGSAGLLGWCLFREQWLLLQQCLKARATGSLGCEGLCKIAGLVAVLTAVAVVGLRQGLLVR